MIVRKYHDTVKKLFWAKIEEGEGLHCPTCHQYAKKYKRKINAGMARSLITMYRQHKQEWVHLPTSINLRSREEGKLRYWGLIEEDKLFREDGGRAGWWRVTDKGRDFVLSSIRVPKYVYVYDGEFRGYHGEMVSISDALGEKFDLSELMESS